MKLLVALLPALAASQCLDEYRCIFHWLGNGREYSYDLRPLCRSQYDGMYTYYDAANTRNYTFNICGNITQSCSPSWTVSASHGVAMQSWGSTPGCNEYTCEDADNGYQTTCCTAPCAILAHTIPAYGLLDPANPATGGLLLTHDGMAPIEFEPDACPPDPKTLYPRPRQFNIALKCDLGVARNQLFVDSIVQAPECTFTLNARSGASCGTEGDPYDLLSRQTNGGLLSDSTTEFGYTVLGAFLLVVGQFGLAFADKRGYLDGVKRALGIGSGGRGFVIASGSVYSKVGASAAVSFSSPSSSSAASGGGFNAGGYGSL